MLSSISKPLPTPPRSLEDKILDVASGLWWTLCHKTFSWNPSDIALSKWGTLFSPSTDGETEAHRDMWFVSGRPHSQWEIDPGWKTRPHWCWRLDICINVILYLLLTDSIRHRRSPQGYLLPRPNGDNIYLKTDSQSQELIGKKK